MRNCALWRCRERLAATRTTEGMHQSARIISHFSMRLQRMADAFGFLRQASAKNNPAQVRGWAGLQTGAGLWLYPSANIPPQRSDGLTTILRKWRVSPGGERRFPNTSRDAVP
jgi:hypothetical protein